MSQQISRIHTSCKNCVFAIYENITQTDCALKYIDKYKNKNTPILEAYDEDKEFYVINNRKCLGYRENKWFAQYDLENSTLDNKIAKFNELNHLHYLMMVDLKNFSINDLYNLEKSIKSCGIQPKKIVFIRYQADNGLFTYDVIKSFFENTKLNCKWRIQTMVDTTLQHEDILNNCCNLNKGYRFILGIKNPCDDIDKIILKGNSIVHESLDTITAITNKDKSAILFSAVTYRWSIAVEKKNILDDESNFIIV
jgi:hypothetical protein